jgi:hypothetical protein
MSGPSGVKRKPAAGTGTHREAWAMIPSAVKANHLRNYSRKGILYPTPPELVPYIGAQCCFTLAQIEARMESLLSRGQDTAVRVYLTLTGETHLVVGFLRHAAMLLAEIRGLLDKVPNAGGKILCLTVTEPKSIADWLKIADMNYGENTEQLGLSDIQKALYAESLMKGVIEGGFGLGPLEAAKHIGVDSERSLARYLRLLKLPLDVILAVHEGRMTQSNALKASTNSGAAGSPGVRGNMSVKKMRVAVEMRETNPPPSVSLTPDEQIVLIRLIGGEQIEPDQVPPNVKAWATWMQPAKQALPEGERPRRGRKPKVSPPTPEEVSAARKAATAESGEGEGEDTDDAAA